MDDNKIFNEDEELEVQTSPVDTADTLVKDLIETEVYLAQKRIQILQGQHQKEKENWEQMYKKREQEIITLRDKLKDTEMKLARLQDEYNQLRLEEIERLKVSSEQIQLQRQKDKEKWDSIEQRIKTYRQIAEETQAKLLEEQANFTRLQEKYIERERLLQEEIKKNESEILSLKEQINYKEQEWLKNKDTYEQEILLLKEQIEKLQVIYTDEKKIKEKAVEKKDEELSKLQNTLQELTIKLIEEKHKNEKISSEIEQKNSLIEDLKQEKNKILLQLEQERKNWQETFNLEKEKWENANKEYIETEKLLRKESEEQINHLKSMIESLELQLNSEREIRFGLEKQLETLNVDKLAFDIQKQEIISKYEKLMETKKQEIQKLNNELMQVKANLGEEETLLQLEKTKNEELTLKLVQLEQEKNILIDKIEQEREEFKKAFFDERILYEERIKELTNRIESIKESRELEIQRISEELNNITGEFNELKLIYTGTKLENEELKRYIQKLENERTEWEKLLVNEQEKWEKRKSEIITRHEHIVKQYELEITRLEGIISGLQTKLLENSKYLEQKDNEINSLNNRIKQLEMQLKNESGIVSEKEIEINRIKRDLEQYKIQVIKEIQSKEIAEQNLLQLKEKIKHIKEEEIKQKNNYENEIELQKQKYNELYQELLLERKQKESILNENKIYQSKIIELKEQNEGLLKEIEFLNTIREKQLKEFNEKNIKLQEKYNSIISQYRQEKEELQREIEHQSGTTKQHKMIIDDLTNRLSVIEQEKSLAISKLNREIELKNNENTILKNTITELEAKIVELNKEKMNQIKEIETKLRTDWQNEIEFHKQRYDSLYQEFISERRQKEETENNNKILASKINELEQIQKGLLEQLEILRSETNKKKLPKE